MKLATRDESNLRSARQHSTLLVVLCFFTSFFSVFFGPIDVILGCQWLSRCFQVCTWENRQTNAVNPSPSESSALGLSDSSSAFTWKDQNIFSRKEMTVQPLLNSQPACMCLRNCVKLLQSCMMLHDMSGCGACPHISKPVSLPSFTHQQLKSLQMCLYTNPPSSSLIALFQIRLKHCSRDMKWVCKKNPQKRHLKSSTATRHHRIAAEIHRPDLLLRHLESHHHQPPGDSSFESTTFACGAFVIEICMTNIASAESTRMTSSRSCHRKALNHQRFRWFIRSLWSFVLIHWSKLTQIPDFTPASFGPFAPMATMEMWSWRNSASLPLSLDLQEHMIHQKPNASEDTKSQKRNSSIKFLQSTKKDSHLLHLRLASNPQAPYLSLRACLPRRLHRQWHLMAAIWWTSMKHHTATAWANYIDGLYRSVDWSCSTEVLYW